MTTSPYFVSVTVQNGRADYFSVALDPTQLGADPAHPLETALSASPSQLSFPTECYVVGQASTTFTETGDTGDFTSTTADGVITAEFALVPYGGLVYLVRAVSNVAALGGVGLLGITSGLLIDTYVPSAAGTLNLAQGARYKRSGLPFYGESYTPTTMVDSLDSLDFTSITGETFYAPTMFIPIPELDASTGFVADLSDFLGATFWTFVYPELVVQPGQRAGGVTYPDGLNLDGDGKPVLSLQKLQFVYNAVAVAFTPNDLSHNYLLQPKQRVLALTNGQLREGICWRSAHVQPDRQAPSTITVQQLLTDPWQIDDPNIVYSTHNRPVDTPAITGYLGMSVNAIRSVSGTVYNIEETAFSQDQTATGMISQVSSNASLLVGVLFDYDGNELGTMATYDPAASTKGLVLLTGYLGPTGYAFSSPDHFDVDDVLPSQEPLLEQITQSLGGDWDFAFYDVDISLPEQFWSFTYDGFTPPSVPNFVTDVPTPPADPLFANRTRSLLLNFENSVRPQQLGLVDTYSSVVSANIHLQNGVTGSVLLSKKADRNVASIGSTPKVSPSGSPAIPLYGLPDKYDFFVFSRDHYDTLADASFHLIDQGYVMCLVDDGSGTGTKVARYYVDTDGNYYELYSYVLFSPTEGILETASFTLKVALGAPGNPNTTPATSETPNNVNPQDLATQINTVSALVFAAFGPSASGQPPAYLPIQAAGDTEVQAGTIVGPPDFGGYDVNVLAASRQPVRIASLYAGPTAYPIAGTTTTVPLNAKQKPVPFYGSLAYGLDEQTGGHGGAGVGALTGTPLSFTFPGSAAVPAKTGGGQAKGAVVAGDNAVAYTVNAPFINTTASAVMDSTGKAAGVGGHQVFVDRTDPENPIWGIVSLPTFVLNQTTYYVFLSTSLNGTTPRYTLSVGGQSYLFDPGNTQVTVDTTTFTFNAVADGAYTVTYAAADAPATAEAPTPITLNPFTLVLGGGIKQVDVFNDPDGLDGILLGPVGRQYSYNPVAGTVTITSGATTTAADLQTGLGFASASNYAYVLGLEDGAYTVNGAPTLPYSPTTSGTPASYPLMTSPQVFTVAGDFYTFDHDAGGGYTSVTGGGGVHPVNPYQFSINGTVYVIDQTVQPNLVVSAGQSRPMTAGNTQFELDGATYTIALKSGSLLGATVSGQFDIAQGNVVVIEDFVYQLDTLNNQVVGNGTSYPLTTSGPTYTITTTDGSFTVTSAANAITVPIGDIDYLIGDTTVVGNGVTYPILPYRSFADGDDIYEFGLDGSVTTSATFALTGTPPFTDATFTDDTTYTVNAPAAFDGADYYLLSGSPQQFTVGGRTYTIRTNGVAITAGPTTTYLGPRSGPLSPQEFALGATTIHLGRASDVAAFDGTHYFAIAEGAFTDTVTGLTYTLSGNTAVNEGNSYEVFSNLGQSPYFEVPGGPAYFINIPVADTDSANGDVYSVFPVGNGSFTVPLVYTIATAGMTATVDSITSGAPVAAPDLTVSGGSVTGGWFTNPVTGITYTAVLDGTKLSFADSGNAVFPYAPSGTDGGSFTARIVVTTGVKLAVDDAIPPAAYPVTNGQFATGTTTYSVGVSVAYQNPAGPYWRMNDGGFVMPRTPPESDVTYTVAAGTVTRGYAVSADDQFSVDGKVTYTVNTVNVVKTDSRPTLTASGATQILTDGARSYALDAAAATASNTPPGLDYEAGTRTLGVDYDGIGVTYTLDGASVTDDRSPANTFTATTTGGTAAFTDTLTHVGFSFAIGGGQATVVFPYANGFFLDALTGTTYYVDEADQRVNALSYLPETTRYGFRAADGVTYLIHFNDVSVFLPVTAGTNVNAGIATVGADELTLHVNQVSPLGGGAGLPVAPNSFELNGNEYSIVGAPTGSDYSACRVVGGGADPRPFTSANTFVLSEPDVVYTLHLDESQLPAGITADFAVQPSRDLILVADDVYAITYATATTGSLLGQGTASIPIVDSAFTLTNPFDTTSARFVFADLDIYDASAVVGQFGVHEVPSFTIDSTRYTLDLDTLLVTDSSGRPYPLIANPAMFSLNGANYVIDTNRVPHAVIGDSTVSPIATDVTILAGQERPNTTFTLGGLVYRYVEDTHGTLLAVAGTATYPIAQPQLTFKLDSSLVFTLSTVPPAAGTYPGTVVPIGTATAGTTVLNVYAGVPESGGADYFTYKNQLYTLIASEGTYEAVQKSYTVYAAGPGPGQQQLVVFDLGGTTYLVTDGTTAQDSSPAGINPGTLWAATSASSAETQFGLVYGFGATPTTVTRAIQSSGAALFQFLNTVGGVTTLYDIDYTAGATGNRVQVDVPDVLPSFDQTRVFNFVASAPLTVETGGYNAFTTFVDETSTPAVSYAASYKTPVRSTDPAVDTLITSQGDFTIEFWHSIPLTVPADYHPVTYAASSSANTVYFAEIDFDDPSSIWVVVNATVMHAELAPPPVFSTGWRHVALSYTQPYTMLCQGSGFEVRNGGNYDLAQDFTVAFTFAATDIDTEQGIVYKGDGLQTGSHDASMSYRVTLESGTIGLEFTDATGRVSQRFTGVAGAITAGSWYEVIIAKTTSTPLGSADGTDSYAPPFDSSGLASVTQGGATADTSGSVGGSVTVSNVTPTNPAVSSLVDRIGQGSTKSYTVTIACRAVNPDGTFGAWQVNPAPDPDNPPPSVTVSTDQELQLFNTGSAHLLLGNAADDSGRALPLGGTAQGDGLSTGNIRDVYLFNTSVAYTNFDSAHAAFSTSTTSDLTQWGIVGSWKAAYDADGVVANGVNQSDVAVSMASGLATLAPVQNHELEGAALYVDGLLVTLQLSQNPPSTVGLWPGALELAFDAGDYHLQEISLWQSARQQFQILDDMFGRLVPSNEPYLALYLSANFTVPSAPAPALPLASFIEDVEVSNLARGLHWRSPPPPWT